MRLGLASTGMGDHVQVQFPVWDIYFFHIVCDQTPRSTQPGQPKGGDDLRLGSKGRYSSCVAGR